MKSASWLSVFEEAIRWVAPIQLSSRRATKDTQIRGYDIRKDDVVMTIQASANHDEEVFENGHLFDVHRPRTPIRSSKRATFRLGTHVARKMGIGDHPAASVRQVPGHHSWDGHDVSFEAFGFVGRQVFRFA